MSSVRLDPYMIWAILQGRLGLSSLLLERVPADAFDLIVPVLIEVKDPCQAVLPEPTFVNRQVAFLYNVYLSHEQSRVQHPASGRFASGIVTLYGLHYLFLESLRATSNVRRFEVALALERQSFDVAIIESSNSRWQPLILRKVDPSPPPPVPQHERIEPLVCVVDDRCNFASTSLRQRRKPERPSAAGISGEDHSAGKLEESRIQEIWFQGPDEKTRKLLLDTKLWESGFKRSAEDDRRLPRLPRASWEGLRLRPNDPNVSALSEPLVYQRAEYMRMTPRVSHGAAVTDLLAGNGLWIESKFFRNRMPPRHVHFVQLPVPTVLDTQGASLGTYVIEGILDALQAARPHQDVIVNVSFGTHSGGHDGSSLFDHALRDLLDRYDGSPQSLGKRLHVVLPAGNSHLWRCQASGFIGPQEPKAHLDWKVLPDDDSENFVEVWVPLGKAAELSVLLPGGTVPVRVRLTGAPTQGLDIEWLTTPGGGIAGAVFAVPAPSLSERGSLFLVVAAAGLPTDPAEMLEWASRLEKAVNREASAPGRVDQPSSDGQCTSIQPTEMSTQPPRKKEQARVAPASRSTEVKPDDGLVIAPKPGTGVIDPLNLNPRLQSSSRPRPDSVAARHPYWLRQSLQSTVRQGSVTTSAAFGAPTRQSSPPPQSGTPRLVLHGVWQIELRVLDHTDCFQWNAWVQRGDTAPMRRRSARGMFGRQSYFVDNCRTKVDPTCTLSGIATGVHRRLAVVGAMRRNDAGISDYSAAGPARDEPGRPCGPDAVVPADESRLREGMLVQGVYSGSRARISGTSMAAPIYGRLLFELLCAHPTSERLWALPPPRDTVPPIVPAGAPQHADPFHRGDPHRILPCNEDGSL